MYAAHSSALHSVPLYRQCYLHGELLYQRAIKKFGLKTNRGAFSSMGCLLIIALESRNGVGGRTYSRIPMLRYRNFPAIYHSLASNTPYKPSPLPATWSYHRDDESIRGRREVRCAHVVQSWRGDPVLLTSDFNGDIGALEPLVS